MHLSGNKSLVATCKWLFLVQSKQRPGHVIWPGAWATINYWSAYLQITCQFVFSPLCRRRGLGCLDEHQYYWPNRGELQAPDTYWRAHHLVLTINYLVWLFMINKFRNNRKWWKTFRTFVFRLFASLVRRPNWRHSHPNFGFQSNRISNTLFYDNLLV